MKSQMIDKPVMIITGTRKGIGKYLAEYYIEKGFIVIGSSRGDNGFKMNDPTQKYKSVVIWNSLIP